MRVRHPVRPAEPGNRCGAAVVEFAIVAPILIALVFGGIEFGRAMMVSNILTNTARDAVRRGSVPTGSNSDINSAVTNSLTAAGISTTNVTTVVQVNNATKDASTAVVGDTVTVSVTLPFKDVTWLPFKMFMGTTANLRGLASMRRE